MVDPKKSNNQVTFRQGHEYKIYLAFAVILVFFVFSCFLFLVVGNREPMAFFSAAVSAFFVILG
jgi:hypothetical protein